MVFFYIFDRIFSVDESDTIYPGHKALSHQCHLIKTSKQIDHKASIVVYLDWLDSVFKEMSDYEASQETITLSYCTVSNFS